MSRGAVIVPTDLAAKILASDQGHGWFNGVKSKSEHLFLAWGTTIGDEEVVSTTVPRLSTHRACHFFAGTYEAQLLEWVVVSSGFADRFESALELPAEEFRKFLATEVEEQARVLMAIEKGKSGPILRAISVFRRGETVYSQVFAAIALGAPQPLARVPQPLVAALAPKSVTIVGLGSGGSEIALNLACAGVGRLALIDYDRLQPENYVRFIAGNTELGRRKIDVIQSAIRERELPTEVTVHALNVVSGADRFRGILSEGTDLVICATDSVVSRRAVNAAAVWFNTPCIIAGTLDGGRIGEVLRVLPYRLPCYECVRMQLGTVLEPAESDDRAATPYLGSEEAALQSTALRSDIALVASLATRVALHELAPGHFGDLPASYVVWGREADDSRPEPFCFPAPLSTNYVKVARRKDCPLCGATPPELIGIDVQKAANEILATITKL
jgi:molybdopterin/thiamine biosynthesis adenylyltransferase